jgi:hypothetical protein
MKPHFFRRAVCPIDDDHIVGPKSQQRQPAKCRDRKGEALDCATASMNEDTIVYRSIID